MPIAIKISHLDKDFTVADVTDRVLFDINVEIRMGELTMLVGPSGCGKTTFISIISGILSSTHGEIRLLNQNLSAMSDQEKVLIRRTYIGFIFQQYHLLPALTAAENAAIPLVAAGIPMEAATQQARVILNQIGMQGQSEKLPRQLSGGEQQRVAIARALVHNPKVIICDEPTAALDAKAGKAVMDILRTIANDKNHTVLVVTHDNRIYQFADRILQMSDGCIVGDWKPEEFIDKE